MIKFVRNLLLFVIFFGGIFLYARNIFRSENLENFDNQDIQIAASEQKESKVFIPDNEINEIIPVNYQEITEIELKPSPTPSIPVVKNPEEIGFKVWVKNDPTETKESKNEVITTNNYTFSPVETSETCLEKSTDSELLEFVNNTRASEGLSPVSFVCLN